MVINIELSAGAAPAALSAPKRDQAEVTEAQQHHGPELSEGYQ